MMFRVRNCLSILLIWGISLNAFAFTEIEKFEGRNIEIPMQSLKSDKSVIRLHFKLPDGYQFTSDTPQYLYWTSSDQQTLKFLKDASMLQSEDISYPYELPLIASQGDYRIRLDAIVSFCKSNSKMCLFGKVRIIVPIQISEGGKSEIDIDVDVLAREMNARQYSVDFVAAQNH